MPGLEQFRGDQNNAISILEDPSQNTFHENNIKNDPTNAKKMPSPGARRQFPGRGPGPQGQAGSHWP